MARTPSYTTPEGRATRDRIIEAAMHAFAARGFRGTAIDAVAAEAGVTRQGLLHHFPSKVQLLVAVLEQRDEEDKALAETVAETDAGFAAVLDAVMRHTAKPEREHLGRLFTILSAESIDADHPAHEHFRRRYRAAREGFAEWIAQAQAEGAMVDTIAPEQLAAVLVAVMDGLQMQQHLDEQPLHIEDTFAAFLRGLRP
ncbi:TetR/AcrR family transcriptional regulator [Solirubrobacter sp. CPCC 204708]|uniref:TetR/AcrR family transcriptional regulator n=1 Tax=Solirubrobacter deserti TaxID=2282478 RepID=A0ABT4RP24_9ACTN|nr:TetR/AcrR family transcriptional regulator [Solirubrobacter deserti]MBE2317507.1 TetR/AcrR family transcriptional regulator [Solirubrobacter deserti]MDA0140317.1 TetR/AcrR family transcriptional regulator [Solirubrobacter deserti]